VDGFRWDTPNLMMNADNYGYIADAGNLINSINAMIHTNYTGKISIAEDVYDSFGFDSAWDTTYPYVVTPVLTNNVDADREMGVITHSVLYNVRYSGLAGSGRGVFLESHDVVGDLNGGVRLVTAIDPADPASYRARKLSTLGAAVTLTAPGVPMIFQGQEMLENQAFDSSLPVDWTKTNTYSYIVRFYRDLISARRNLNGQTPGLEGSQCEILQTDNINKVIAFDRWSSDANQKAVVIANFSDVALTNYAVSFPSTGNWYIHLNTDSTNYGPDYENIGGAVVVASGNPAAASINVGPYTVLILSLTPAAPPQLSIMQTNGVVNIFWPAYYFGWTLDSATNLAAPAWSAIPASQYQTNASTISVTVAPSNLTAYYQLYRSVP
jgi:1,4-alpha-glucan branching enzyme